MRRFQLQRVSWLLVIACALWTTAASSVPRDVAAGVLPRPPRPPEQPIHGPGGREFAFEAVDVTRLGRPPTGSWLFEPTSLRLDATKVETEPPLPVVIFLHGFTALDPDAYRAWIDHIVRRGAIVIYPDYQTSDPFAGDWDAFLPNSTAGIRMAMQELGRGGRAVPYASRVAVVGHSLGAVLATGYATAAADEGLPAPSVLMLVQPGGCAGCGRLSGNWGVPLPDLTAVPANTMVTVIVGEDDPVVGSEAARIIWEGLRGIPLERRDFVTLRGDHRGLPPLRATHLLPQTGGWGGRVDALDWFGTWKLLDLLMGCAFRGEACDAALGNTPEQRYMGVWSDGEPVTEAKVTDFPPAAG